MAVAHLKQTPGAPEQDRPKTDHPITNHLRTASQDVCAVMVAAGSRALTTRKSITPTTIGRKVVQHVLDVEDRLASSRQLC
jgi:hypothetical protein